MKRKYRKSSFKNKRLKQQQQQQILKMSSSIDFTASLIFIQTNLYRIGGPIIIIIGTTSSIISLIVFCKKVLRKNPCSVYFVAFNVINFLYVYASILPTSLSLGYAFHFVTENLPICRLIIYTTFLFDCLSPFYLIMASVDRILITSSNVSVRQRSTCRLAYKCIIGGALFWMLFQSHALVWTNILQVESNYLYCYFSPGIYFTFIAYYSLIIKGILVPLLMASLGLWTIKNIRNIRRIRVNPHLIMPRVRITNTTTTLLNSKDRQLVLILLVNIIIYILFSFMLTAVAMYEQITQNDTKSFEQIQIDLFARNVAIFSTYIPFCVNSYINLFVSNTFRNEVKHIISCK
ncbi:unnamed protein product [Adineta steineri]|uniref:G-protein coupled receptors family 1 profile domain-containing protein n=1 Tax=Adineta steineri TaxID=433720 RepID=A0A819RBJ2_9BILA|nr:unnamed protein product [Adineta steineri]CAF4036727.1 unnamed protein product [Adineta steineri]